MNTKNIIKLTVIVLIVYLLHSYVYASFDPFESPAWARFLTVLWVYTIYNMQLVKDFDLKFTVVKEGVYQPETAVDTRTPPPPTAYPKTHIDEQEYNEAKEFLASAVLGVGESYADFEGRKSVYKKIIHQYEYDKKENR